MGCEGGLEEKTSHMMQCLGSGPKDVVLPLSDVLAPVGVPTVAVLLASFNGVLWIAEQMASILQQSGIHVTVFVSDDQSADGTREWLVRRSVDEPRIILLAANPRFGGAARNFFRLIRDVDFSAFDYVALADQDDIWLPSKLIAAHRSIVELGVSAYSSNVTAFWLDGRERQTDKAQAQRKYDFLFEAAGPGCTYVMKTEAAERCKSFIVANWADVNACSLHDWLIYAWFRASGLTWYIDQKSYVRYRQHHANQVGVNTGWQAAANRLSLLQNNWYRSHVGKIVALTRGLMKNDAVAVVIGQRGGAVSLFTLLRHGRQFRRRARDRYYLWFFVILGIY